MKGSSIEPESLTLPDTRLEKKLRDEEERYAARLRNSRINVNSLKIVIVGDSGCGKVNARICLRRPHDHIESSRLVCFMHFRKVASQKYVAVSSRPSTVNSRCDGSEDSVVEHGC